MTTHTADMNVRPRSGGLAARAKPDRALSTPALLIAAALAIVLIGVLLVLATPSSTTVSRHIGHGASVERRVATPASVASAGTRACGREMLRGRVLSAGKAPLSALLRPPVTGT
jgi:hypothetical protein